jgi:hypothetical protein
MSQRKHHLPSRYDRLRDQITGPVLDSIVVYDRSHGRLHLPGQYGTDNPPPAHDIEIVSTDTDNQGIQTELIERGSPELYAVSYDVWNNRNSPAFAQIILTDHAGPASADTPGR